MENLYVKTSGRRGNKRRVVAPVTTAPVGASLFKITCPYGVYRLDGSRLDGYTSREKAIASGNRFLGRQGFVLTVVDGPSEFIPASR